MLNFGTIWNKKNRDEIIAPADTYFVYGYFTGSSILQYNFQL